MTRAHGSFRFRLVAALAAAFVIVGAAPVMAEDPVPPDGGGSSGSSGANPVPVFQEGARILTDGQEVRVLIPGRRSTIEVIFVNQGDTDVRGAVAVAEHTDGATVSATRSDVGTIPARADAVARFDVTVDAGSCAESYGIGGQLTSDDLPEPVYFKASFPVACPGARLSLAEVMVGGGDGDNLAEPGETVTLTVVLLNTGADPAKGVTGRLTVRGEGVEAITATATWPDIAPGESASSTAPFVLRIAADAPRQHSGCGVGGGEPVVVDPAPASEGGPGSTEPDSPERPVSSDGNASSEPAFASDTPIVSEPAPPFGAEPAPMPMPAEPPREPAQSEPGVEFDAVFEVGTTNDERFTLEFSNRLYCSYTEDGAPASDLPAGGTDAARLESSAPAGGRSPDGPAVPVAAALLAIVAALVLRQAMTRGFTLRRTSA